jgi:8-oxo-dGTP diphosphatase
MTGPASGYTYPFPMTSVATDIAVFHVTEKGSLQIALVRRNEDSDAFPGAWALPGGFFKPYEDQDIISCALRELSEEAGVTLPFSVAGRPHVELVGVYSAKDRDPRPERVISIAHLAVVTGAQVALAPVPDTDVSEARWFPFEALGELELAFDHAQIISDARRQLADSMSFAHKDDDSPDLLFAFLPDEFTLTQAQVVMQALKGQPVDKSNFRKYIDKFVTPTGETWSITTRPAAVFRRRSVDPSEDDGLFSPALARLRKLAEDQRIRNFELLLSGLTSAPDAAVRMLTRIVSTYGRHRDYLLKVTRVPDLRIDDERTGRVLMTLKWQPRKEVFFCTALAKPDTFRALGLSDVKEWNTGPHQTAFHLGCAEEDLDKLDQVLGRSSMTLVAD